MSVSRGQPVVRVLGDEEGGDAVWQRVANGLPQSTLAHAPEWRTVIRRAYGHEPIYLVAEDEEGQAGVLPAFLVRRPVIGTVVVLRGTLSGKTVEQQIVTGINKEYGPSGFEFVLGNAPVESDETLYVQLVDLQNIPLSDPVYVTTSSDCTKNLVLVRFKRNR